MNMFFNDRDRQEREEAEREGRTLKEEDLDNVDMPNPFQPITNVVSEVSYHYVSFKYKLDEIIMMQILNSHKNPRMKTLKRCKERKRIASRAVCKNRQSFKTKRKRRRMKRARDRPQRAQNQVISCIPQKDSSRQE